MNKFLLTAVHLVIFFAAFYFLNLIEAEENKPFELTERQITNESIENSEYNAHR